ncbi:MAG: glycosyltransferase [bacterium]
MTGIDVLLLSPRPLPGLDPWSSRVAMRAASLARRGGGGGVLLSPFSATGPLIETGVRHVALPVGADAPAEERLAVALGTLAQELRRLRPRVVHAFDPLLAPPVLTEAWRGVKLIVEPGLTASWRMRELDARLSVDQLDDLAGHEDRCLAAADAVVARSPVEANGLVKRGVSPTRIWVVRDGPLAGFGAAPPGDLPHLVFLGGLAPKSGWDLLVEALARVRGPWRATFVLTGADWEPAERLIRALRLEGRITFARVGPDTARRVEAARLVVCPARPVRSLLAGAWVPPALSFAASAGRPVIAPDLPVVEAAAGPGMAPFSPDDAASLAATIERLLARPRELASLAEAARARLASWSWDPAHGALATLWTSLASPW